MTSKAIRISDLIEEQVRLANRIRNNGKTKSNLQTGIIDYDNINGGIHTEEIHLIAGKEKCGKTTLITYLVSSILRNDNVPVLWVCINEGPSIIARMIMCQESRLTLFKTRRGDLSDDEMVVFSQTASWMKEKELWFIDVPQPNDWDYSSDVFDFKNQNI